MPGQRKLKSPHVRIRQQENLVQPHMTNGMAFGWRYIFSCNLTPGCVCPPFTPTQEEKKRRKLGGGSTKRDAPVGFNRLGFLSTPIQPNLAGVPQKSSAVLPDWPKQTLPTQPQTPHPAIHINQTVFQAFFFPS